MNPSLEALLSSQRQPQGPYPGLEGPMTWPFLLALASLFTLFTTLASRCPVSTLSMCQPQSGHACCPLPSNALPAPHVDRACPLTSWSLYSDVNTLSHSPAFFFSTALTTSWQTLYLMYLFCLLSVFLPLDCKLSGKAVFCIVHHLFSGT